MNIHMNEFHGVGIQNTKRMLRILMPSKWQQNWNQTLVGLNIQLHKSQLRNKMIKSKGNDMGKAKDMCVVS
jgi:hypothetical protein